MVYRTSLTVVLTTALVACQVSINGGGGAAVPDPNAQQPQPQAQNQTPPAPTTPPPSPPSLPAAGPAQRAARGITSAQVMATASNGQQAPVMSGQNDFGSGIASPGSLTGTVYYIPENSPKFPDVSTIKPSGVVYTQQLNIAPRAFSAGFPGIDNRFEWFALRYVGNFNVSVPGEYKFRVLSDDGANVYVDGKKIVDNDGIHPPQDKTGSVTLSAGQHAIQVDYYQGPRDQIALQLFVTPPGGQEKLFTTSL